LEQLIKAKLAFMATFILAIKVAKQQILDTKIIGFKPQGDSTSIAIVNIIG